MKTKEKPAAEPPDEWWAPLNFIDLKNSGITSATRAVLYIVVRSPICGVLAEIDSNIEPGSLLHQFCLFIKQFKAKKVVGKLTIAPEFANALQSTGIDSDEPD